MEALFQTYADTVVLYNKTHDYHLFCLDMPGGFLLHEYTGKIYEALVEARDSLGEQIKAIGEKVPTSDECVKESNLKMASSPDSVEDMVEELYEDNETIKDYLLDATKEKMDEGTRNLLADRLNAHAHMCNRYKSLMDEPRRATPEDED